MDIASGYGLEVFANASVRIMKIRYDQEANFRAPFFSHGGLLIDGNYLYRSMEISCHRFSVSQ